jgi:hypothetical protein
VSVDIAVVSAKHQTNICAMVTLVILTIYMEMTMSDTTKEDKETKFYPEDLCFDSDELEEAIHQELEEMDINFTKFSYKIIVEYETQENDDDEGTARIADPRYREDRSY